MAREIIISGGDSHFFPYLSAALNSLRSHSATAARDYGIIDQGLTAEQKAQLSALGCRIVRPEWTLPIPEQQRQLRNIGLVARTALRDYGPGYRKSFVDLKWWTGNMIGAYGVAGVKLALVRSINIGVLCLTDTAPHWDAWLRAYSRALERMGKVNLDQHAFLAAIHLDKLATTLLPARYNWLPHLSRPIWNPVTQLLCEPVAPYRPLSVVHLA